MDNEAAAGRELLDAIRETSRQRLAAPLEFFKEFLREIWMDNSPEEALAQWRVKVEQFPWYATDALTCLDAIIADPPSNLVEIMQQDGWIMLYHESATEVQPYTFEEYLEWLRQMRDEFQMVYDAAAT